MFDLNVESVKSTFTVTSPELPPPDIPVPAVTAVIPPPSILTTREAIEDEKSENNGVLTPSI